MTQGCNKLNKFWNNERKCFKGEEMKIWEEEIWFERWGWVLEKEEGSKSSWEKVLEDCPYSL